VLLRLEAFDSHRFDYTKFEKKILSPRVIPLNIDDVQLLGSVAESYE